MRQYRYVAMVMFCICQRGELAIDRASDTVTKLSIQEAMSRHDGGDITTTESCLETMRSEISFAATQHRNLVEQMNAPTANQNTNSNGPVTCTINGNDTRDENCGDTASGSSRTLSVSSSSADE